MGWVIVEGDSLALITALKNFPRNVISGIRSNRFALNPVWVVIVEGESLALFTALKNSPRNIISGIRYSL